MSRKKKPSDSAPDGTTLNRMMHEHLRALGDQGSGGDALLLREHLASQLTAAGLSPEVIDAILQAFDANAAAVNGARAENEELRRQFDAIHASAARRLGRVTRVTHDAAGGREVVRVWIDDTRAMVLPTGAALPKIGETIEYADGDNDDAVYFGSGTYAFDHAGLASAQLKRVQTTSDGRVLVEVVLRETGDREDTAVAVASHELQEVLDDLEEGAPVRVTERGARIAYTAPAEEEKDQAEHAMFTEIDPISEDEDNFVYHPDVVARLDYIVQVHTEPERARQFGITEMPGLLCLEGPTGTGKTTIAERYLGRAFAQLGFQVLSVKTEELTSCWYGESEKLMKRALTVGGDQDVLIILDEVDSVLPKRASHSISSTSEVSSRTFAAFVNALNTSAGDDGPHRVVVFTTNYFQRLDAAIKSRIDETITVGLPTQEMSTQIAQAYLSNVQLDASAESIASDATAVLDFPLVRAVLDGSDEELVFRATELLTGRSIEKAVQAVARDSFTNGTPITPFTFARELKGQLHANLADLGQEDLGVALGLTSQDAQRVTSIRVNHEALVERAQPTERELRVRFRLAS